MNNWSERGTKYQRYIKHEQTLGWCCDLNRFLFGGPVVLFYLTRRGHHWLCCHCFWTFLIRMEAGQIVLHAVQTVRPLITNVEILGCLWPPLPLAQSYLLAGGILADQEIPNRAAGNLQGLEEGAQGMVYLCLPLADQTSIGLPLAWLQGVTVEETFGETCGGIAGLKVCAGKPIV